MVTISHISNDFTYGGEKMAYNTNGKTYTDNPLMDEICHYCKRILQGIVIKNDVLANNCETENSLQYAEMYCIQYEDGYIPFSVFPFNEEYLLAFGYTNRENIKGYIRDRNNIPEEDRDRLTRFCNEKFASEFEEENNYYRMLMGLPLFGTGEEYYVYLTKADIPAKYLFYVDLSVPLHLQPKNVINVLYSTGNLDKIRARYPGSNYSYLSFLGNRSIELYKARKAPKWDILYVPNIYYLVLNQFTEFYKINRELYLSQTYLEVHQTDDYYDQLMIILVLAETFANMITDVPEWYIRRDIFDIRSVKYFLESYGVKFFKEIPLKYQTRIVKNIDKIIKFKSSNRNIEDIINLFTKDTVNVYKYWLLKKRKMDENGEYIRGETTNDNYDLEFITSDIYESFDDYIKNMIYRHNYDDITYQDKYWDGEDTHSFIHDQTIEKDFTIEGTKYMSIDYKFDAGEYGFQVQYFLGLILDSKIDLEDVRVSIPTVDEIADFSLTNIFLYLIILSDSMYRKSKDDHALDIRYPDHSEGKEPSMDHLLYHDFNLVDWRVKNMPEIFVPKRGRVAAFNTKFDRAKLEETITKGRHSHYLFGRSYDNVDFDVPGKDRPLSNDEYAVRASQALDDWGINDFVTPGAKYDSINELVNLYQHNKKTYKTLIKAIMEADDEDELSLLAYVFQELYTREFDEDFYNLDSNKKANSLVDVLKYRDFILYDSYLTIMNESNYETRRDIIRGILNDVVETLEFYLQGDGLDYLFSFTPVESFFNIVYYIYLMITFFKSYEVYFLDPYMTMVVNNKTDPLDGTVHIMDRINELKGTFDKSDKAFAIDRAAFNGEFVFREKDSENVRAEMVDLYSYKEEDPAADLDYDGRAAFSGEDNTYEDMDGGIADPMHNLPYRDLDAGSSYLGRNDIDDLNGGAADEEPMEEYMDIDGGDAYHSEDERTDWYGTQGFNYILDGGGAANNLFRSRTLETRVFANTIQMNVIISKKEDNIASVIVAEDKESPLNGFYVGDVLVSNTEFQALINEVDAFITEIRVGEAGILAELKQLDSWDDVVTKINQLVSSYIYNIVSVNDDVMHDKLLTRVKQFVDSLVELLHTRYDNANPYGFVDL